MHLGDCTDLCDATQIGFMLLRAGVRIRLALSVEKKRAAGSKLAAAVAMRDNSSPPAMGDL